MKKTCIVIILILSYNFAFGQSLTVFEIDTTNFPTMKANFYAFDKDGKQILNLSPNDFEIKENGVQRTVLSVSCPAPKLPVALSAVLVMDGSSSMEAGRLDMAKEAAKSWIKGLPEGQSECAITSFNTENYFVQDFTKNKKILEEKANSLIANGGTDYNAAFSKPLAGGILVAQNGKYKRVIIILSDGEPNFEPETQEIINQAKKFNITVYAVTLNLYCPQNLKDITTQTGGVWFENVTTIEQAKDTYDKILHIAQGNEPCEIEWESGAFCDFNNLKVNINLQLIKSNFEFEINNNIHFQALLNFQYSNISFKNIKPGTKKDTLISVTSKNFDLSIIDIESSNTQFSISPKNFFLKKGETKFITVTYIPVDSSYTFSKFTLITDKCTSNVFANGGFKGYKPSVNSLKLIYPNGGEEFVVGSDTLIIWEGINDLDTCLIEYSIDNGKTWKLITDTATGLKYIWKNIPPPTSNNCRIRISQFQDSKVKNFLPQIEWEKTFGGNSWDNARVVRSTYDGCYLVGGYTDSKAWLIKLSSFGDIMWQKNFDKFSSGDIFCLEITKEQEYLIAGEKDNDFWILKLDETGNELWEKKYGGSGVDVAHSVKLTTDGGCILTGTIKSGDGDVTGNKGDKDFWVLKLDAYGNKEWQKPYGGSKVDESFDILETKDGDYVVVGYTTSNEIKGYIGDKDFWIIKINSKGNILWQQIYGTQYNDEGHSVLECEDGSYLAAGWLETNTWDGWLFKISSDGELLWKKNYGGDAIDVFYKIIKTADNNYLLTGYSSSKNGELSHNNEKYDYWAICIDDFGNVLWSDSFGGSDYDLAYSIDETIDGGCILAGMSSSNNGDKSEYFGSSDYWVVKLSPVGSILQQDESDSLFAIVAPQAAANDIDMKEELIGNVKDSVITDFVSNTGTYPFRVDSVYFSGADKDAFKLVSGFPPFDVEKNSDKSVEIRFIPNRLGLHQAKVNIITQSDTLVRNIIGEGVEPKLIVLNNLIDFGKVAVGEFKDTIQTATIKYIGNSAITIKETKHNYPNKVDFSTLEGGGSFTLQPNEIHKMDLRFTPSSIGRTSGTLEFHYDGVGSPAIIQLYGQGLGGKIVIDNDSAFAGEKRMLRLRLGNNIKPKSDDLITGYHAKISYNPTLLSSQDVNVSKNYSLLKEIVEINGKWDGKSDLLGEFEVIAGLGNADSTYLLLEEFQWLDENNQPIDYEVETQNGSFKLLGICYEGGARLLNPNNKVELLKISPNPNDGNLAVELNLLEKGTSTLSVYNSNGELMFEHNLTGSTGKIDLNINTKEYANGIYFVSLQTPTIRKVEQLVVFK